MPIGRTILKLATPIAVPLLVATGVAWHALWRSGQDRRRSLYSDAYRTAMAWAEMVYRVKRRSEGSADAIVARFHDLQEQIAYHQGWLMTEAPELGRSYARLVRAVREEAEPHIQQAWQEPIAAPGAPVVRVPAPITRAEATRFLTDARDHLSAWPWKRWAVRKRNTNGIAQAIVATSQENTDEH